MKTKTYKMVFIRNITEEQYIVMATVGANNDSGETITETIAQFEDRSQAVGCARAVSRLARCAFFPFMVM